MPTNGGWVTDQGGWIQITATEGTLDQANNRSQINVQGVIWNKGSGTSTHKTADIPCSGDVIDPVGDDAGYTGSNFAIGVLGPNQQKTFISFSEWAEHDESGAGTASAVVRYGTTGTTIFGNNKSISVDVPLTQLATAATSPSNLEFSNILPTSVTLSWDAPSDDGGWPVSSYLIQGDEGDSVGSGSLSYTSSGLTKNITGLQAGQDYTFQVYAYNGHGSNGGYSTPSDPATVQTLAGAWARQDGVWKVAIPYIRDGGTWKMAVPYIRSGGTWQPTH